jgi:predicted RNA polymerase sigma factor
LSKLQESRKFEARLAYRQAIGLSDNATVREFLQKRALPIEA